MNINHISKAINLEAAKFRSGKKEPTKAQKRTKRLKEWREYLKNDEDWSYQCILDVLRYKLERTRKCILENDVILDAQEVHDQIKEVEDLLSRVVADDYFDEFWAPFEKNYGHIDMVLTPLPEGGGSSAKFRLSKDNPRNRGAGLRAFRNAQKKADKAKVDDLKKAFDLMAQNIWGWWD